jgi:hypothetical protein
MTNMKKQAKSAVSNGRRLFAEKGVDGRSIWARRFRDLCQSFAEDAGGMEALTAMKLALIRRAASITIASEKLEARLAAGEPIDPDLLSRLSGQLHRIGETLGLTNHMTAIDPDPTLDDILARRRGPGRPRKGPL